MNENLPIPAEFAEIATICVAAEGMIGNRSALTVNARDLHTGLQVRRDFSNWIKGRVSRFGFVEHQDFESYADLSSPDLASAKARPQETKEYRLTLDMAKELSMVENNEKGRLARRYFIWREQQALCAQPSVSVAEIERRMISALGGMVKGIVNKQIAPKIEELSQKVDGVLSVRPVGVAVVTHRTAKGWLQHYGVTKRRRGMSVAVSNALMRQSIRMGFPICYTAEEEKRSFHQAVANAFFNTGAGRHLLPRAVKGQKEMGLEETPANFPKVREPAS